MKLKQGTVLPTTGIGTGYMLLFIYAVIGWNTGFEALIRIPFAYLLLLVPAVMQFSYKDFIVHENDAGYYTYLYRVLFLFKFKKRRDFRNFSAIVIRVVNKQYNVQQGVGPGIVIAEGKHREKYLALVGYKGTSENSEICKGKREELDEIIRKYVLPFKIPVYLGAPKKGYEYILK